MLRRFNSSLDRFRDLAPLTIRFLIGFHLLYGTYDKIFSMTAMQGIGNWFLSQHIPFPLFSAYLSAYSQFICAILFLMGAFTRLAAGVMIINFLCAISLVHIGDSYPHTFPALTMLAGSFYLLLNGAGVYSIDRLLRVHGFQP